MLLSSVDINCFVITANRFMGRVGAALERRSGIAVTKVRE